MIAVPTPQAFNSHIGSIQNECESILDDNNLELQHFLALQTHQSWQDIWEIFYSNAWFRDKLKRSACRTGRNAGLRSDCQDDIMQEALIEFSKALQRHTSLRYDSSKGSFYRFISTILYRCCIKGLRQFKTRHRPILYGDFMHPLLEEHAQIEKLMDFRHIAKQIPEPYQGIIRQLLAGDSIPEIAKSRNRSKRTVYRWVKQSIGLLKEKYLSK